MMQCILLLAIPVVAEKPLERAPDAKESNFLQRKWYADQGGELPRMFGAGINAIYMKRDIEVVDVSIAVGGLPAQCISDRADFDVQNETTLSMARFDVWALPFLNVYAMLGETRTETSVSTRFEVTLLWEAALPRLWKWLRIKR